MSEWKDIEISDPKTEYLMYDKIDYIADKAHREIRNMAFKANLHIWWLAYAKTHKAIPPETSFKVA